MDTHDAPTLIDRLLVGSDMRQRVGARPIFLAWEILRPIYNGVIFINVIAAAALLSPTVFRDVVALADGFCCWVLVNVFYFAGPALESYIDWLGWRHWGLRLVLLIAGTLLTIGVAIAMLGAYEFSTMIWID